MVFFHWYKVIMKLILTHLIPKIVNSFMRRVHKIQNLLKQYLLDRFQLLKIEETMQVH